MSVGDVASELLVRDVERALGQLGRQHARDGAGLDRGRSAALGVSGLPRSRAEARRRDSGEAENRAAGETLIVHAAERSVAV